MSRPEKNTSRPQVCMVGYFVYNMDARVQNYVKFLLENEISVDVICLGAKNYRTIAPNGQSVNVFVTIERKEKERHKTSYLFNVLNYFFLSSLQLTRLFFQNRHSVIHIHNMPDFLVFAALIPKFFGAKIILDIHDVLPELYARKFRTSMRNPLVHFLRWIEKLSCQFADYVIVANDVWRDQLIQRFLSEEKCESIPNFPDRKFFSRNESAPLANPVGRPFTIIYHGSFTEHHGLDVAIRAAKALKDRIGPFRFHLFGWGSYEKEIRSLIREMHLEDLVLLH